MDSGRSFRNMGLKLAKEWPRHDRFGEGDERVLEERVS
jgi:hypothetical protein